MLTESSVAITCYDMNTILNDYITNAIGVVGSNLNLSINEGGISQVFFSQWQHMISIKKLHKAYTNHKKGVLPKRILKEILSSHNKKYQTNIEIQDLSEFNIEAPSEYLWTPVEDPWIFFQCKKGCGIYDLIHHPTPKYYGTDLSEVERAIIHLIPYMEELYILHPVVDPEKLIVYKSKHVQERPVFLDYRVSEESGSIIDQGIPWQSISMIDETLRGLDMNSDSLVGKAYTLPPDIEAAVFHEWRNPNNFPIPNLNPTLTTGKNYAFR